MPTSSLIKSLNIWQLSSGFQATFSDAYNALTGVVGSQGVGTAHSSLYPADGYIVIRCALYADTSELGAGAAIVSARIRFYCATLNEGDVAGYATLHIVEGVTEVTPVPTDFQLLRDSAVSGGSIPASSLSIGSNAYIDLNATGISWINTTGITKFGWRLAGDINGIIPVSSNLVGTNSTRLEVTYYKTSYPNPATASKGRIGSLVHRRDVDRGIYNLEITFGGLIATPPSTGRASMTVGAGEEPYNPVPEVIPTCPPGWTLRYNTSGGWYCEPPAITGQPYSKLTNLTPYAQQRAQSLYEQGMIDESGQITEYGRWWISQHPTESPP